MLILGIDDAGRGPVIGPMVLAGVLVDSETEKQFVKLGVKDSKLILPKKREILSRKIKELSIKTHKEIISVDEIDGKKEDGMNLNEREALAAAMIINKLNPKKEQIKVIIDCPSVNLKSWKEYLEKFLIGGSNLNIACEHKADFNHVTVAAASIIAKVTRDNEVKKLKEKFGVEFGSGYSSDPNTRKFIYENYDKFKGKGIFRESWKTIKKHRLLKTQKKLF
ncbi:ribonuclease HII [Candidatus Pacearchaeota archaeon]|nr:ribonuclease HII [Candidatus Pacearchaeota archaeon]|tara:strand:+ start:32589 stop:33254 length:666 start_codon:yes stop_codon:yes gene_type:complete